MRPKTRRRRARLGLRSDRSPRPRAGVAESEPAGVTGSAVTAGVWKGSACCRLRTQAGGTFTREEAGGVPRRPLPAPCASTLKDFLPLMRLLPALLRLVGPPLT